MRLPTLAQARSHARGTLVRTSLGTMHAVVRGTGPHVILLHGVTESAATFLDLQEALESDATLHAIDLPGHGLSDIPASPRTFDETANWVRAYLDAAKIERAIVLGWSLGGGVAITLAAAAPERVSGLVLVGSVGGPMPIPFGLGLLRWPPFAELMMRAGRDPKARRRLLGDVYHPSFSPSDAVTERSFAPWRVQGRASYLRTLLRSVELDALPAKLSKVRAPTEIVHGQDDRIVPFRIAMQLRVGISDSQLHALRDTGHAPHLEEPAVVRAALRRRLAAVS